MSQEELLEQELAGWTVTAIEDAARDERIFAIVAQKDGKRKRVIISATGMGWWVEKVERMKQAA